MWTNALREIKRDAIPAGIIILAAAFLACAFGLPSSGEGWMLFGALLCVSFCWLLVVWD